MRSAIVVAVVALVVVVGIGAPGRAASLTDALASVALPQVVSTDALDRTLPAIVVRKDGAVGLFASSAEDAASIVAPRAGGATAVQSKLAPLLRAEGRTSVALFFDDAAPGDAVAAALAAADRAGASSYSLAVHGHRAVRAARPPVCDRGDALADRCAEVRYAVSGAGVVVSAADVDVGVEGCEPASATANKRKGPRAAWDGAALQAADGACPLAAGGVPAMQRDVVGRVGDCARARVVVEQGASGGQVTALVKALREAGVEAVTVVAGKQPSSCRGAAPLATLDVGLPFARKPAAPSGSPSGSPTVSSPPAAPLSPR